MFPINQQVCKNRWVVLRMGSRMGAAAIDYILKSEANCLIASQNGRIIANKVNEYEKGIDFAIYDLAGVLAMT